MSSTSKEVPHLTCNQIVRVARQVRQLFRISDDHCPVVHILESIILVDPEFTYEIRPRHLMRNDLGLTIPEENTICLRSDVYDRAVDGHGCDRFTVAHELGHHFLHKGVKVVYHQAHRRKAIKLEQDSEWQANIFGAALMMPIYRFQKCKTLDEAVKRFGVSKKTAAFFNRALDKARLMKRLE